MFHSWDKVQSVFLHLWPAVLTWCGRWYGHGGDEKRLDVAELTLDAYKHYTKEFWIYPMTLYIVWQVAYLIKTEIMDAKKFRDDPELVTSLRWISMHTKNRKKQRDVETIPQNRFLWSRRRVLPGQHKNQICVRLHAIHLHYDNLRRRHGVLRQLLRTHVHHFTLFQLLRLEQYAIYYIEIFSSRYQQYISVAEERERITRMSSEDLALGGDEGEQQQQQRPLDDLDRILKHPR